MVQGIRALAVLAEDQGSVPSTQIHGGSQLPITLVIGDLVALSGTRSNKHTCGIYTYIQAKHKCIE